jgi:protein-tyrosine phosphatase
VAQRITRDLVSSADLILTAEASHRSTILQAEPSVFRRTFTMREFARLGQAADPVEAPLDVVGLRTRVTHIADQRGWVEAGEPGSDEVGDPYGANLDVARRIGTQISDAVDATINILGLSALPAVGSGV